MALKETLFHLVIRKIDELFTFQKHTVKTLIRAAALINFLRFDVRLLFEGGCYSRAALNSIFSKFIVKLTNLVAKFVKKMLILKVF